MSNLQRRDAQDSFRYGSKGRDYLEKGGSGDWEGRRGVGEPAKGGAGGGKSHLPRLLNVDREHWTSAGRIHAFLGKERRLALAALQRDRQVLGKAGRGNEETAENGEEAYPGRPSAPTGTKSRK